MKLQAKVHNPEAAAEIRNWLENQGYIVTTQNIAGAYNIILLAELILRYIDEKNLIFY